MGFSKNNLAAHAVVMEKGYELHQQLGKGAFADVVLVVQKATGHRFALKIIEKSKCQRNPAALTNEVSILQMISHPNIVGMLEVFQNAAHVYLVMELVTGGELFDRIIDQGSFSEVNAAALVRSILEALDYLHSKDIAHRDLKPENLLFASPDPNAPLKLCDFGLARIQNRDLQTKCGSPGYVSPEILKDLPYTMAVDLWSLGVIAYILLCGYMPFYQETDPLLFEQIMRGDFEFDPPAWDDISGAAKDFIARLLVVNPAKRMSAAEALRHPWIAGNEASAMDIHGPLSERLTQNFRQKWRAAINAVKASERMRRLSDETRTNKEMAARPAGGEGPGGVGGDAAMDMDHDETSPAGHARMSIS